jgi:hypothetical protein
LETVTHIFPPEILEAADYLTKEGKTKYASGQLVNQVFENLNEIVNLVLVTIPSVNQQIKIKKVYVIATFNDIVGTGASIPMSDYVKMSFDIKAASNLSSETTSLVFQNDFFYSKAEIDFLLPLNRVITVFCSLSGQSVLAKSGITPGLNDTVTYVVNIEYED